MTWWMWVLLGVFGLAVEILLPGGIVFLFFGAAALLVGGLVAFGLGGPVWFQWLLFSVLSVASMLSLRGRLLRRLTSHPDESSNIDSMIGQEVVSTGDLLAGANGQVQMRGTTWSARNVGTEDLDAGGRAVIERVDGVTLHIRRS